MYGSLSCICACEICVLCGVREKSVSECCDGASGSLRLARSLSHTPAN